jgi:hypothetical protein
MVKCINKLRFYLEESFKWFACHEGVEAAVVETEGAENVRQRSEDFSGSRNVLDEKSVQDHVRQTIVLKRRQKRRLLQIGDKRLNDLHF